MLLSLLRFRCRHRQPVAPTRPGSQWRRHSMPAVISKHLERLPLEDFHSARRQVSSARRQVSSVMSVPVATLRTVVPEKRIAPPVLSWSSYSAKEGIEDPELAQGLLQLVSPLSSEALEGLASKGHDRTSLTYWILAEEVHALKETLNNATSDLREICQNAATCEKLLLRARKRIKAFSKAISIKSAQSRSLVCWSCREPVDPGNLCGFCRSARYCSRRCQKQDWETHRQMCTGYTRGATA